MQEGKELCVRVLYVTRPVSFLGTPSRLSSCVGNVRGMRQTNGTYQSTFFWFLARLRIQTEIATVI